VATSAAVADADAANSTAVVASSADSEVSTTSALGERALSVFAADLQQCIGYRLGMRWTCILLLVCTLLRLSPDIHAETVPPPPEKMLEAAKAITKITGVAISPLLGTGAIGAYEHFTTPKEKRYWYANPWYWLPALLLVVLVAVKDAFGATLPPGWKKPLDVAETIENKVSGLVAAGAFVPLVASIFGTFTQNHSTSATQPMMLAGLATINFSALLNIFTIPLAVAAFVVVWLVGHVVNVLILISPWGAVDAALKACRTSLIGLLAIVHAINPWTGAFLSLIIIVISYFLAGWSFRLTVFGSIFVWDFITGGRHRFKPDPNANWMFTARRINKVPIRTYGKLLRGEAGKLTFEYRPLLFRERRTLTMPEGNYVVGRGLFYPELMLPEGEKSRSMLTMPPRYRTHEEEIATVYGLGEVRDVGLLKGFKAMWNWLKSLFGVGTKREPVPT